MKKKKKASKKKKENTGKKKFSQVKKDRESYQGGGSGQITVLREKFDPGID